MRTISLKFLNLIIGSMFLVLTSCKTEKGKTSNSKTEETINATATFKVEALTNHEYTFNGVNIEKSENPDLTLKRGHTYVFDVETFGHPFLIKTKQVKGIENIYKKGITNNGTEYGKIIFTVSKDAPNTLFYICKFHQMMTGKLLIVD